MRIKNYTAGFKCFLLFLILTSGLFAWRMLPPTVFVLGDSISIQYGPHLEKFVDGTINLVMKPGETINGKEFSRNGGDSRKVLAYVNEKLTQRGFKPDYILLNCGLHDVGYDSVSGKLQVPIEEYRSNLTRIFSMIQQKKITIIWVSMTPVVDSIHNSRIKLFQRFQKDVLAYNAVATELCKKFRINVIDLHDFTARLGPQAYIDNVHYKDDVRALQGAFLAGAIKEIIKEKP
jgi:lysophospholipase L1-like esterase